MKNEQEIKEKVREKYSRIAQDDERPASGCGCSSTSRKKGTYNIMSDDYTKLDGYVEDADLGLGCGLPTEFALIKTGDTVIDLGSGAGNDAFIARKQTGDQGLVIGVDFTEEMVAKATNNAQRLGYSNVDFRYGDIDQMPVDSNSADVVVSNCVLNLVPDKNKVFSEIFRVLKPGGHFSISDIVLQGTMPEKWKSVAELYAGCVSGALPKEEYLSVIENTGFSNLRVQKYRIINIPDDILAGYLSEEEIGEYKSGAVRIASITVYAEKPGRAV